MSAQDRVKQASSVPLAVAPDKQGNDMGANSVAVCEPPLRDEVEALLKRLRGVHALVDGNPLESCQNLGPHFAAQHIHAAYEVARDAIEALRAAAERERVASADAARYRALRDGSAGIALPERGEDLDELIDAAMSDTAGDAS